MWRSDYQAALSEDTGLDHVEDRAKGSDVIALPVPDWLREDLQLQLLPLPHLQALRLETHTHTHT